jgi:hypothetical protein
LAALAAARAPAAVGASAVDVALSGAVAGVSRGPTVVLLPPPRRQAYAQPRRAAAPDTEGWQIFESRATRWALDFDLEEEREQLSQHILKEYAQRFQQPLSPLHIRALAALFGWLSPDDVPIEEPVECVV